MQVFVNRSDLTSGQETVNVIASYDDDVVIDQAAHGTAAAMLILPSSAVVYSDSAMTLAKGWRDANRQQIASMQATKRIDDVFPEYSQRNSTAELTGYLVTYGADASKWPVAARARKTEIDRCWNYVNAIRAKAAAMAQGALPSDPTANSNWPTVISPYQPQ